ncbi:hypothetical protein SprV_0301074000 [Sparganum proliferum]
MQPNNPNCCFFDHPHSNSHDVDRVHPRHRVSQRHLHHTFHSLHIDDGDHHLLNHATGQNAPDGSSTTTSLDVDSTQPALIVTAHSLHTSAWSVIHEPTTPQPAHQRQEFSHTPDAIT